MLAGVEGGRQLLSDGQVEGEGLKAGAGGGGRGGTEEGAHLGAVLQGPQDRQVEGGLPGRPHPLARRQPQVRLLPGHRQLGEGEPDQLLLRPRGLLAQPEAGQGEPAALQVTAVTVTVTASPSLSRLPSK